MKTEREVALELYLKDINRVRLLTADEEKQLSRRYRRHKDVASRDRMITANLRLVVNIAKRYSEMGLPFMDLIEEGNLGLMHAVERFDPDRNCRFSTYATCWIKHAICRALTEKNQVIRIPSYMRKLLGKCKQKARGMVAKGLQPTSRDVVNALCVAPRKAEMVHEAMATSRSLDQIKSLNQICAQKDLIEDMRSAHEIHRVLDKFEQERLLDVLRGMDARKAEVLRLRFGLEGRNAMTLKEIGRRIGLTKERVRQIEKEMLGKLRALLAEAA